MEKIDFYQIFEAIWVVYSIATAVVIPIIIKVLLAVNKIKNNINYHFNHNDGNSLLYKIDSLNKKLALRDAKWRIDKDLNNDYVFECDASGQIIFASNPLCKLFGMAMTDMLGNGWMNAVVDKATVWEKWHKALEGEYPYEDQYCIRNKQTGDHFMVEVKTITIRDDNKIIGHYGIVKKITNTDC